MGDSGLVVGRSADCGRVDSQRMERSQDSRDESCWGVRGGRGRVIVEIVCVHTRGVSKRIRDLKSCQRS